VGVAAGSQVSESHPDPERVTDCSVHILSRSEALYETPSFFEFSLCLSRACLGKMIIFIYKWYQDGVSDLLDRRVDMRRLRINSRPNAIFQSICLVVLCPEPGLVNGRFSTGDLREWRFPHGCRRQCTHHEAAAVNILFG
jgi:hypothetical protein